MNSQELSVILHGGGGTFSGKHGQAKLPHLRDALNAAWSALCAGAAGEEAVVAALKILEAVELFDSGFGAYPNVKGEIELDVGLMTGEGKFASLLGARNLMFPSAYALELLHAGSCHMFVWTDDHAKQLAAASPELKEKFGYVKDNRELLAPFVEEIIKRKKGFEVGSTGTVGCVVRDASGRICAGTSTGGVFNKPVGRVGDSPVIGAGVYADSEVCGLSATGKGEAFLAANVSGYVIAEVRRHLRENKFAFADDEFLLREILETEFAEFSRVSDGRGALIVMPPLGRPAYAFNSERVSLAMRSGTVTSVSFEDVLVDSQNGEKIRANG